MKMKKSHLLWLLAVIALLAVLAVLIPGTSFYLPKLLDRALGEQYDGHSASYWKDNLQGGDIEARRKAIRALGGMGADGGVAVSDLAKLMLEDPDRDIRDDASLALSKMAPATASAVPALILALDVDEQRIRAHAAIALRSLGSVPEARSAVPALLKAIKEERNFPQEAPYGHSIQETVAVTLGGLTTGTPEAVPALMAALDSPRQEMQEAAVRALGLVGPEARAAVPRLQALVNHENAEVRISAREALKQIEGTTASTH